MTKKIKIAWLHPHLMYWLGGTKFILEVTKRLKLKADIEIFVENASETIMKKFYDEAGVKVKKISWVSTYNPMYWLFSPIFFQREIKILRKRLNNFDILLPSMFPMNYAAMKAGDNQKILQYIFEPFVFFYDPEYIDRLPFMQKYGAKILRFFYKKIDIDSTQKADKVLTLCQTTKDKIKDIYNISADITYEGVDVNFFKDKENPDLEKKYQGFKIIIHSTDFTPIKGTSYVIKALSEVVKVFPKTKLLITQTLENKKEKKRIINLSKKLKILNNIEFLGFVDFHLLPDYYSLADVLVHAGISQTAGATTMSLPVKEALACQTPVVRSNDTNEEVIDGKSGYLVNPKETLQMAGAIVKILKDEKIAKKMGIVGRAHIINNFTWDIVAKKFWQSIKEVYDSPN